MAFAAKQHLAKSIDGASLACFRIGFGAVVFWEVLRYFYYDWVTDIFVKPTYLFPFPLLPVSPWPRGGLYVHFFVLGLAAFCVAIGLFQRVASWALAFALAYVFLLDASYSLDLNHLYLMVLFAFLLATMPAANAWSVDNHLFRRPEREVPQWTVWALRSQIFLVIFFAGIAKLSPEWLKGRPAEAMLANHTAPPWLMPLLHWENADNAMKLGGLAVDLLLPWLLFVPATRKLGLVVALVFLALNGFLFPIGVFPALAAIAVLTFLNPSWPRFFTKKLRNSSLPASAGNWSVILVPLYLALQVFLPLRALAYPSPSGWSEEGHFFGWRMMGLDKQGTLTLTIRDPRTGSEAAWDLTRDLTPRQIYSLSTRPLLVQQYARHVADEVELNEHFRPQVFAHQTVRMGRHPEQLIIDPTRDLAKEPATWKGSDWIVPLVN